MNMRVFIALMAIAVRIISLNPALQHSHKYRRPLAASLAWLFPACR
jgi:hypothetical protein